MSGSRVVLLSNSTEQSKKLVSMLKSEQIPVTSSDKIDTIAGQISSSDAEIILLNYQSIIGAQKKDLANLFNNAKANKFVVYDVPDDATRRNAFYRLGAYRVLRSSYSAEDIFYFTSNTLQKIKTNGKLKETHFSGSLQDFNLSGLINLFGREKRSGILRIRTQLSMGKIYFSDGNIIQAVSGNLRADDAVFYMLTWTKGWFSMRPLPIKQMKSHVQLSNIGIVLYGEQVVKKVMKYLSDLGGIQRQARIVNQGDLLHLKKDLVLADFVKYLQEYRRINEIIELSPYSLLETLEMLAKYKQSGHLDLSEPVEAVGPIAVEKSTAKPILSEQIFNEAEIGKLREVLNSENLSSGKLLVLGCRTCGKTEFIHNLNPANKDAVRTNQDLDFTRIDLAENFHLQVFGIVLDRMLMKIVEKLSEGLLGYVFLVDAQKPGDFEYTSYLINYLTGIFQVPWTVAVTNIDTGDLNMLKQIKANIRMPDNRKLMICDVSDKDDVRKTVLAMRR